MDDFFKVTLTCRFCKKKLLNILTIENIESEYKIRAECPFCEGESATQTIKGRTAFGPVGRDESSFPTLVNVIDQDKEGVWIAKIVKG